MAYGPPPEPNEPAPHAAPPPPQPPPQQQHSPQPQQWGGASAAARTPGPGLAVASVVLGLVACALPLLPFNLDLVRQYLTFPFGFGGLVLAIGGCTGGRRGRPVAVTGIVLCGLALGMGVFMVAG
ncbi:hypothetical protein K378_05111 [Streptomyces sp. Amel2xB2]|uniref:hypothetical protein n=1 Tax=Streptomyces sp. Amel2xB2 TaxID=1305829 RepID=UPI000DBA93AE|nr:hypothetical protein [Streptomyces sp. Amel2xB2]RAJ58877.1 hypothetical protein K378_05111 [Streptomyces sp. Amel2xB2]